MLGWTLKKQPNKIGMTPHYFTPSLHLVPFCQLCTPQNSLLFTPTKWMDNYTSTMHSALAAYSTAFCIQESIYVQCSTAAKLHNRCGLSCMQKLWSPWAVLSLYGEWVMPCSVAIKLQPTTTWLLLAYQYALHAHAALPTPLPSTTFLCAQNLIANTRLSWQNGTKCRDGVKVMWCRSHLVWLGLRVPSLFC